MDDRIDLKELAAALAAAGLLDKAPSAMSREEILQLAELVYSLYRRPCLLCDNWRQANKDGPWWDAVCRISGQRISNKSFCHINFEEPPF